MAILCVMRSKNICRQSNAPLLALGYRKRGWAKTAIGPIFYLDENQRIAIERDEIYFAKSAPNIRGNGGYFSCPQELCCADFPALPYEPDDLAPPANRSLQVTKWRALYLEQLSPVSISGGYCLFHRR